MDCIGFVGMVLVLVVSIWKINNIFDEAEKQARNKYLGSKLQQLRDKHERD